MSGNFRVCKHTNQELKFNFFDFKSIENPHYKYNNSNNYFCKIPNNFIKTDIRIEYGLHRIFYVVWFLIDRMKNYENISRISIGNIMDICGYKRTSQKPAILNEIIKCLLFLIESSYICADFNYLEIGYDDIIEISIISENFCPKNDFTIIYGKNFDLIKNQINPRSNFENMFMVYLYVCSHIINRSDTMSKEHNPEAYYGSLNDMVKTLHISKKTASSCINALSNFETPLFIKKETDTITDAKTNAIKKIPNIYVINKDGYKQEIKWALEKITKTLVTNKNEISETKKEN